MPYRLETKQQLTADIQAVWDFWATISAFAALQPPQNQFQVTDRSNGTAGQDELTQGLEVGYRLRLAPLLWSGGRQLFSVVDAPTCFVDEQLEGTWKSFRHQHLLEEIAGGVEIRNIVDYELALEPFSRPLHALLVAPGLQRIVAWDRKVFAEKFGELNGGAHAAVLTRL